LWLCRHRAAVKLAARDRRGLRFRAMRAEPSAPPDEFVAFCHAVQSWLRDAPSPDPSLAAVADLVETLGLSEEELHGAVADAADTHAALGASALLSLWSGLPR
jgi:hypothetical protein